MASNHATNLATTSRTPIWSILRKGPLKVLVLGGGNWGTTIGRVAAQNAETSYLFDTRVTMWLKEVEHEGRPLTEKINTDHVNPVYLPDIPLPHNLIAVPDLFPAASEADLIILVVPHQFVESTAHELAGRVKPTARALSLVKGISVQNGRWPLLPSELFSSVVGIPCMALSGANVANDIARGQFSETTLGYDPADPDAAALWLQLLDQPHFKVNAIPDICGVEASGALKNVVALAAGFCDALGYGTNTKAALIRLGAEEMKLFTYMFFNEVLEDTYFDSAGFADLITTCFGGRNVRCAQEFVRREGKDDWTVIENDLLAGQKMQGQLTCHEVYQVIRAHQLQNVMRLFTTIYKIAFERLHPSQLLSAFAVPVMRPIKRITECTPCTIPDALKRQREIIQQKKHREHQT